MYCTQLMLTKNKERRKQKKQKGSIILFWPGKSKLEITHGPLENII